MARTPLADIILTERIKQAALSGGNPVVVKNNQGTTATLYAAAAGATTITNSQTVTAVNFTTGLSGYLEPGAYEITCGGALPQVFDTGATDEQIGGGSKPSDDLLSVSNTPPRFSVPSVSATTTDGQVKFVRIVPDKEITAASVVLYSGTAVA